MPKRTPKTKVKKTKTKKTKKLVRKTVKKSARKRVVKATSKRKTVLKRAKPVRKAVVSKSTATVKPSKPPAVPTVAEQRVGIVTHYYSHLSVAVVKLDQGALQTGDSIHIKGHTTDFQQRVDSMQIEHQSILRADVGQEFGLKVSDHVREHDVVYKILG